jgi:TetR/AcrR family transcriptional repressor of uid operon
MGRKTINRTRYKDKEIKKTYVVKLLVYFQNNGIRDFSMSKLATDFNVSKTTLYNHFESKEDMINNAIDYKLSVIGEYESVLENITLSYIDRYRKAILFFCVQSYKVSSKLLSQIREDYPIIWKKVLLFQKNLLLNLQSYYEIGIQKGVFIKEANPLLLSLNDGQFFQLLSYDSVLEKNNIDVLTAFNHHFKIKFYALAL